MMDIADIADEYRNRLLSRQIEAAKQFIGSHGPAKCLCGEVNNRATEGYATCSDCLKLVGGGDAA